MPPPATPPARPVDVVHLSAERAPFARTGGLGEAVRGLVEGLGDHGLGVAAIVPLDRTLRPAASAVLPDGAAEGLIHPPRLARAAR